MKVKKLIATVMAVATMASVATVNAGAYNLQVMCTKKTNGMNHKFSYEWAEKWSVKSSATSGTIGVIKYGYDTDWTNEDYTETWSQVFYHDAITYNSRYRYETAWKGLGYKASAWIKNGGATDPRYYLNLQNVGLAIYRSKITLANYY